MFMMLNLKGGVAKTTNSVGIAEQLAFRGNKVLCIDADHQYTASELLLGEERYLKLDKYKWTLHDLLRNSLGEGLDREIIEKYVAKQASNVYEIQDNMDCIPCSYRIDAFTSNVSKAKKGFLEDTDFQNKLKRELNAFRKWCKDNYDFVIIDCPPSLSIQVRLFLKIIDGIICPTLPDRLSIRGTLHLLERIKKNQNMIKPLGTLWSMVRIQNPKHKEMLKNYSSIRYKEYQIPCPFDTTIPNKSDIANVMEFEQSHNRYRDKYPPQVMFLYDKLCREILERIG